MSTSLRSPKRIIGMMHDGYRLAVRRTGWTRVGVPRLRCTLYKLETNGYYLGVAGERVVATGAVRKLVMDGRVVCKYRIGGVDYYFGLNTGGGAVCDCTEVFPGALKEVSDAKRDA